MGGFVDREIQKKRENLNCWLRERAQTQPLPEGVTVVRNIPYRDDGAPEHRMDLYRPEGAEGPLPVVVNIHGGGLVMGCKEFNQWFCAQIAALGYVVFCPEYALVPEVTVFRQLADVAAAMDAVGRVLEQYQGDAEHIYLVGDSAGAYLILYTAAMQRSEKLARAAGVTPSTLPVRALGLISGMFYTVKPDEIGLFLQSRLYGKDYRRNAFSSYRNPEHPEILGQLPPAYLMTSRGDMLRRYTLWLARALGRAGRTYQLADYAQEKRLTHAFSTFYPEWEESREANREMMHFLRRY